MSLENFWNSRNVFGIPIKQKNVIINIMNNRICIECQNDKTCNEYYTYPTRKTRKYYRKCKDCQCVTTKIKPNMRRNQKASTNYP